MMASPPYDCSVLTPQWQVLSHEIVYANVPVWDGQSGFLVNAGPVLTKLGYGSLRLDDPEGESELFFVGGGFWQMTGQSLSIITDEFIPAKDLDAQKAQEELEEVERHRDIGTFDAERQRREETRAKAMLNMARRHAPSERK